MATQPELHADDVVALKSDESRLGVVEITHGDVDSHVPYPGRSEPDRIHHDRSINKKSFDKFMKDGIPPKGSVMIRWQHKTNPQLIPESKLVLVDRSLLMGDVVKRNPQDPMSGVIINTFTKCKLQPMCDLSLVVNHRETHSLKGLLPPTETLDHNIRQQKPSPLIDVPACELQYADTITEQELVIYKDWIGRVEAVTSAITLRLSDNCVVEISDGDAEHIDGVVDNFCTGDVAQTKKGYLRNGKWIYGRYNPNTMPVGTVVQVRDIAVEVSWLQRRIGSSGSAEPPPSPLERDEFESRDFQIYDKTVRPKSQNTASDTISNSEIDVRLEQRVRFKDLSGACVKYNGEDHHGKLQRIERTDTLGYDLNVFDVVKFSTDVTVQWQDLTITQERSVDLVPDLGIDDVHAAWPGEIAHSLNFSSPSTLPGVSQPDRVGVVQRVNPSERMAQMRWCPGATFHYAEDEETPDMRVLLTGVVGIPGNEYEEVSLYDVEAPGAMNVRRGDGVLISYQRWKENEPNSAEDTGVDWFGEIVDTGLDGSLVVRLGAAKEVRDVVLRREDVAVAVRSDGTDDVDQFDQWANEGDYESVDGMIDDDEYTSEDASSERSEEEEEMDVRYEDENGMPLNPEDVDDETWESDDGNEEYADPDEKMVDAPPESQTPATSHSATPPLDSSKTTSSNSTSPLQSYLILDGSAPSSHHYAASASSANPTWLKRVQKEHKILRTPNNLPKGVYVRTWESRLDLLRVLFVGPEDTPYAKAPFVVDFHLPDTFPTSPPQAHFHSWTSDGSLGGTGRVNPNLYENGKICLSLLGTWEGSKGEGWSAAQSTLLQVLVSILGLVLVKEPYFNEAGFEPLAGLESSKRPSALYSERAYLRSQTFIIKALAWVLGDSGVQGTGIEGLQDVLQRLYKDEGLLKEVIKDVDAVLEKSESGTEEPNGLGVVSKGACILLKRIREQLVKF